MRAVIAGLALCFLSVPAFAQQAAAAAPQAAGRTMVSAADVTALIAKAKVDRKEGQALLAQSMIQLAPYNVSLEYRAAWRMPRCTTRKRSSSTSWTARAR